MKLSSFFSTPLAQRAISIALPILALIAGRIWVDTQWNMPRIAFSLLLFYFFAAFLQRWAAVVATLALEGLLLNISYIKEAATSEPLLGVDLLEIGQGMALTGYMDWHIWVYALITVAALIYGIWQRPALSKTRVGMALILCVLVGMQLERSGKMSAYAQPLMTQYLGSQYSNYNFRVNAKDNGILGHLMLTAETAHKPKAGQHQFYSQTLPAVENPSSPDIVVVMCESCYTEARFPTQMAELTQAGFSEARVISPVYGGGTAEAEFEALTGLSAYTLPGIDFQNFAGQFSDKINALPHALADVGYTTIGMHNYFGTFWKREKVYPKMGFQRIAFVDQMYWKRSDGWPKDFSLYNQALAHYKVAPAGKKQFMFLVTVNTHGPFIKQDDSGIGQYQERLGQAIDEFKTFTQQIEASAKQRKRDVIIVIFGDHKPALNQEFFERGILDASFFSNRNSKHLQFKNILSQEQTRIRGDVPLFIKDSRHPEQAQA
ncbi:MAG: LTA synthase family protein, partial [Deefgea sp.]